MKNLKIISAILLATTFLWATNITSAYTINNNQNIQKLKDYREKQYLLREYKKMQNMSIEELQNIITKAKINSENRSFVWDVLRANAKMAWLAAAQIAELNWYPLSAKLIENSIFWIAYGEIDWMFAKEIKKTSLYKNTLIKNKSWSDRFSKEIHSDLFYSIRTFSYSNNLDTLIVKDTFDFEKANWRFWFFTNIINDWALLNQNLWVLNPIEVEIFINKNR